MAEPNEPPPPAAVPRWVAPVFAVLGAATVPWTVHLAMTLPEQADTHHYRLTWVGFDIMLVVVLLATAYVAWRGHRLAGLPATVTATMLVVDAWFDVTTSIRADRPGAILSAVFIELPLAAVCGWIALHVDQVTERRLTRRAARPRQPTARSARGTAAETSRPPRRQWFTGGPGRRSCRVNARCRPCGVPRRSVPAGRPQTR